MVLYDFRNPGIQWMSHMDYFMALLHSFWSMKSSVPIQCNCMGKSVQYIMQNFSIWVAQKTKSHIGLDNGKKIKTDLHFLGGLLKPHASSIYHHHFISFKLHSTPQWYKSHKSQTIYNTHCDALYFIINTFNQLWFIITCYNIWSHAFSALCI